MAFSCALRIILYRHKASWTLSPAHSLCTCYQLINYVERSTRKQRIHDQSSGSTSGHVRPHVPAIRRIRPMQMASKGHLRVVQARVGPSFTLLNEQCKHDMKVIVDTAAFKRIFDSRHVSRVAQACTLHAPQNRAQFNRSGHKYITRGQLLRGKPQLGVTNQDKCDSTLTYF